MTRNPRRNRTREVQARKKNKDIPKLNLKKVFVFILLPFLLLLCFIGFKNLKTLLSARNTIRKNPIKYYTSFVNNLWGVIDSNGNEIIPNEYKDMITIPNKEKDVFIVTYDIKSKDDFSTRVINKNANNTFQKKNILPIEYLNTKNIYDQNLLAFKENNLYGFIDYDGKIKCEAKYSDFSTFSGIENRIIVNENGKKGVINTKTFETVVAPVYKSVEAVNESENTAFIVVFDNLKGITSSKNKTILPAEYKEVIKTSSNKYFAAKKTDVLNIYDEEGKEIVSNFKFIPYDIIDNLILSKNDSNKAGAVNFKNEIIIPFEYDHILRGGLNTYIVVKDNKYNISQFFPANKDIKEQKKDRLNLLKKDYVYIEYIPEGNFYLARETDSSNILDIYDSNFELKTSGIIDDINYERSFIKLKNEKTFKYLMFNFEEKSEKEVYPENNLYLFEENGKLGFVNDKNNIIVPAIYDDAKTQNAYGFIAISRDNKWGVLDHNGNILIEPSLDLKDFPEINFIKDYYLDKNIELFTFRKANNEKSINENN